MKLNLSPKAVKSIAIIQQDQTLPLMLDDIDDFIIENASGPELACKAMECLQSLRIIKKLLINIASENES